MAESLNLRAAEIPLAQPSAVCLTSLTPENTVGLDDRLLTGWLAGRSQPLRVGGPPGTAALVARQGSAFVLYFMDHEPRDWLDVATHHDMDRDTCYRKRLIERGIFHFPMPTKQGSISFAHTSEDIEQTLEITRDVLPAVCA